VRDVVDAEGDADDPASFARLVDMCRRYYGGDPTGALEVARSDLGPRAGTAVVEHTCNWVYGLRERCRSAQAGRTAPSGESETNEASARTRAMIRTFCEGEGAVLSSLPERPPRPAARPSGEH